MSALSDLWEKIPKPFRTFINVALGTAVVVVAKAILAANGLDVDWNTVWDGIGVALSTLLVRTLNPLDSSYGITPRTDPPEGGSQDPEYVAPQDAV